MSAQRVENRINKKFFDVLALRWPGRNLSYSSVKKCVKEEENRKGRFDLSLIYGGGSEKDWVEGDGRVGRIFDCLYCVDTK